MTEIQPFLNQSQKILSDEDQGMYDPLYKPTAKPSATKARPVTYGGNGAILDSVSPYKEFGPQEAIEVIPDEIMAEMASGRTIDDYEDAIIRTIRRMNRWFIFKTYLLTKWSKLREFAVSLAFWRREQAASDEAHIPCWQDNLIAENSNRNLERVIKCYDQFGLFSFEKDDALALKWSSFFISTPDYRGYNSEWVSEQNEAAKVIGDKLASLPKNLRGLLPTPGMEAKPKEKAEIIDQTAVLLEQALNACYSEFGLKMQKPHRAYQNAYQDIVPFLNSGVFDAYQELLRNKTRQVGSFCHYLPAENEKIVEQAEPGFVKTTLKSLFETWQEEIEEFFSHYSEN